MRARTRVVVWQVTIAYASASASASSQIGLAVAPGQATALSGTSELAILLSGEQCSALCLFVCSVVPSVFTRFVYAYLLIR